jgi:glycosyltransferase involved in cell wall biosynthesis
VKKSNSVLVFATQHMLTGGIESHLQEFCRNLAADGVTVDLVILNSEMSKASEDLFRKMCRHVYLAKLGRSRWRLLWLIKIGLQLTFVRYKSLYTNGQGDSILLFSKLIRGKGRWVHHHHTAGDRADQQGWSKYYITLLKQAGILIACSTKNAIDMSLSLSREIESVPCFSRQIAKKDTRKPGKIRIGYYGRLIPEKGIGIICKMSEDADFNGVEFHLWGEGEAYRKTYFNSYSNLNFHGPFYSITDLTNVIHLLDAFILITTHGEGLPICLLESMSAGLPWLSTDKGGISDIVSDAVATRIISSTSSYEEIKAAVLAFADDINSGLVSNKTEIELYQKKFSSDSLTIRWKKILGV